MGATTKTDAEKQIEMLAGRAIELEQVIKQRLIDLKDTQLKIDEEWAAVQALMISNDVKSIKGDWGSLTIAERLNWDYDASQLPKKFFKLVVDTKKLTDTFRLEGKAPPAAFPRYTKYLVRRIK